MAHVEGEPDDWHDFLVPSKHDTLEQHHGDEEPGAAADPFSEALLHPAAKNPYGSPRFGSPRCRGA